MTDLYIATTGNDSTGDGTFGLPWATLTKALSTISNGDTVYCRAGTYAGATFGSTHSGASGSPKTVRAFAGEQAIFNSRVILNTGSQYISFLGHEDVRLGVTAGTLRFVNTANVQHVIELYGTGNRVHGCDIDHGGGYEGSCVALGWNGQSGQYRAVSCEVSNNLIRNIGLNPELTNGDSGHDHGVYTNYALDCVIQRNVILDIASGWGVHHYTESGSARHVDNVDVTHNTIVNTRDGGVILGSDGTSDTRNSAIDSNLCVDCGDPALTGAVGSFSTFWGGNVGSGNTGSGNHSHNPGDWHVEPGMTGWTLAAPSNGDPLFVNAGAGDYRLSYGSPAQDIGAFDGVVGNPPQITMLRSRRVR